MTFLFFRGVAKNHQPDWVLNRTQPGIWGTIWIIQWPVISMILSQCSVACAGRERLTEIAHSWHDCFTLIDYVTRLIHHFHFFPSLFQLWKPRVCCSNPRKKTQFQSATGWNSRVHWSPFPAPSKLFSPNPGCNNTSTNMSCHCDPCHWGVD